MTIVTIRPNTTLVSGGATNPHIALSDNSDATAITMAGTVYGTPVAPYCSVAFADITGLIPAGRTIVGVRFFARLYAYDHDPGGQNEGYAAASLRYSDSVEAVYLRTPYFTDVMYDNYNTEVSSVFATPPIKGGSWTYALVDGLKAYIGSDYGASGSPMSTADVWIEVTYTDVPAVPTAVTPASGSTATTATPTLGATLAVIASGQTQHAEWQLATNSGFTTNLRTVTEASGDNRVSGATTEPCGARLAPGVWYLHARSIDQYGLASAYSAAQTFTIAHVPSTSGLTPSGGGTWQYAATTDLDWTFNDSSSSDAQTAYQVIVERNDTGVGVLDTGKVASATTAATVAITTGYKDIPLRWKVRVWDTDDTVGSYSSYAVFVLADLPVITITAPTEGGTVATGAPTITWTFSAGGSRTQVSAEITIRQTSDNAVVWTTAITGIALSVTPPTTVLVNGVSYSVSVDVVDSSGLANTDTNLFTTSYVSPNPIEYTITDYTNTLGYVHIDWSSTPSDSRLVYWHIYRRELPSTVWELIYEVSDELVRNYYDYLVKSGKSYMYTVTQIADRSGTLLESPVGSTMVTGVPQAESRIIAISLDNYWLIVPDRPELTMLIPNVTSDPSSLEFEDATYNLIGRGRHRDYGDELGYTGTLTFQIRQSEVSSSVRQQVEDLRRARETYWLRTPFGRLIRVALGNIGWAPLAGTGRSEMGDITLPYEEVV